MKREKEIAKATRGNLSILAQPKSVSNHTYLHALDRLRSRRHDGEALKELHGIPVPLLLRSCADLEEGLSEVRERLGAVEVLRALANVARRGSERAEVRRRRRRGEPDLRARLNRILALAIRASLLEQAVAKDEGGLVSVLVFVVLGTNVSVEVSSRHNNNVLLATDSPCRS